MANSNNIDGVISTTNPQITGAGLKLPDEFNNSRTTGELARLINYSKNTTTIYNKYAFNTVPDKQRPLMTWSIGQTRNNFNRALKDVVRISKYSISGTGLRFAGKQLLLQGLNAFNETKLYNPLMPIVGSTHYATFGLVDRPIRFIEPNLGGVLGALGLKSVSSLFGIKAKPTAPKGTVGISALPNNAQDGGKGLLRGKTATDADGNFSSKWGPTFKGGGFFSKIGNFLKSNTAIGTFFPIKQPDGTVYKVGELSYGWMRLDENNNLTYYTKEGVRNQVKTLIKYTPSTEIGGIDNNTYSDIVNNPINSTDTGVTNLTSNFEYYDNVINKITPHYDKLFNSSIKINKSYTENKNQQFIQKYKAGTDANEYYTDDVPLVIDNTDIGDTKFKSAYGDILNSNDPEKTKLFNKSVNLGNSYEELKSEKYEQKYTAGTEIGGNNVKYTDVIPEVINSTDTLNTEKKSIYGDILDKTTPAQSKLFNKSVKIGDSFEESLSQQYEQKYSGGQRIGGKGVKYTDKVYINENNSLANNTNDSSELKELQKKYVDSTDVNLANFNTSPNVDASIKDIKDNLEKLINNPSLNNKYSIDGGTYVSLNYSNLMDIKTNDDIGLKALNYKSKKTYEAIVNNNTNVQSKNTIAKKGMDTNNPDNINLKGIIDGNDIDKTNYASDDNNPNKYYPYADDIIAFYFKDIVNDKYIPFRATVTGIQEQLAGEWSDVKYINRADKIYTYSGFSRTLSFKFNIAISSVKELLPTWKRINYFVGLVKPSNYTDGLIYSRFIIPPLIEFTIGDMYKSQPAVITQIGLSIPDSATWETLPEEMAKTNDWQYLNGRIQWRNSKNKYAQFPMECELNVNMNLLEKEMPHTGGSNFGDLYIDKTGETYMGSSGKQSFSGELYNKLERSVSVYE